MDYTEAVKRVRAEKLKDNYLLLQISTDYNCRLLLPHKDAIALLDTLKNAEQLYEKYNETPRIAEASRELVTTTVLSHQEYERFKIAALLNLSLDEVKGLQQAMNQSTNSNPPST